MRISDDEVDICAKENVCSTFQCHARQRRKVLVGQNAIRPVYTGTLVSIMDFPSYTKKTTCGMYCSHTNPIILFIVIRSSLSIHVSFSVDLFSLRISPSQSEEESF